MNFSLIDQVVGNPQIQLVGNQVDATPRMQPGAIVTAVDNWWGAGEFLYARAGAGIRSFGLCSLLPVFDATLNAYRFDATEVANTTNLGRMLCVAGAVMTVGQYGWFAISGNFPVNCNASIAADTTFGIAAAGQGGANTAGKQVLNARIIAAATTTVAKTNCQSNSGSLTLYVPNSDGWFVGAYLSGTGVAALTIVSGISPDGRTVTLSVATTAAIAGTVTATYNNATVFYNIAHLNRPFAQGAIT